ncbi:MAG: M20/M25/M40 family metallo-hydrolase [Lachnospiraceae bacterium]|nr:M20/M25/M40 family metallo-hydrolase [Lachnospiraceae bacterium]
MENRNIREQFQNQIEKWVEQDKERIISFFSRLVQCETSSDHGDTRSASALIKELLEQEGLSCREIKANEIMPNLISAINTGKPGRHLMFNGHLDVMPAGNEPGWTDSPWSGKIADGKVWGRGSSDMKAGAAAMLFAYIYLSRLRGQFPGKVSLTLVSDEETGYERGTGFLFEQMEREMLADCVLTGEPSGTNAISFSSKGYIQFTVKIQTRGAIAGYSNESRSAIEIAASVIQELKKLETIKVTLPAVLSEMLMDNKLRKQYEDRRGRGEAELLNRITVDVTTIKGGDLLSVIAPECTFTVAVVTPVGADPYLIYKKAQEMISHYSEAELVLEGISVADISDPDHEMVKILQDTVTGLGWEKPEPVPDIAISDCRHWRYRGIPAFWYGPDGSRCSAANEYVSIDELLHLVRTHTLAAVQYLVNGTAKPACKKKNITETARCESFAPEICSIPSVYAACMTGIADSFKSSILDSTINELLDTLYGRLTEQNILAGAAAIVVMEQKKIEGKNKVLVTAAFPVDRNVDSAKGFELKELPEIRTAAAVVHRGSKSTASSWSALCRFASENGYKDKGIYRENYIVSAPNPANQWATELQLPLNE